MSALRLRRLVGPGLALAIIWILFRLATTLSQLESSSDPHPPLKTQDSHHHQYPPPSGSIQIPKEQKVEEDHGSSKSPLKSGQQQAPNLDHVPRPKSSLDPSVQYISFMTYAGLTNQFIALENAAYLAKRLNRTLIIPPITTNSHDAYNSNQRWSDFYDLPRFTATTGIAVTEWDDVRPLTPEQALIGRKQAQMGGKVYAPWDQLADDLQCQVIYGFGDSENLHTTEWTFARQFLFRPRFVRPPARKSWTKIYERKTINVKDNSNMDDIVVMDDLVDRYKDVNDPLLFLSHSFKLRDPEGKNRVWNEIGRHFYFVPKVMEYARHLIEHRVPGMTIPRTRVSSSNNNGSNNVTRHVQGDEKNQVEESKNPLGRYIALHIRRGDIVQKCRSPGKTGDNTEEDEALMMRCITPLGHFSETVERARSLAGGEKLAVIVTTDSRTSEDHVTIARLGWRRLNHALYTTETELGIFGPAMVDAAILASAEYFVGTYKSTMTKIAAERQRSWYGREPLYPRTKPLWAPPKA